MSHTRTRFTNLDVLRILAALGVCFYHFNWRDESTISRLFAFGYLGVNVFFCVSGYITPLVLVWSKFRFRDTGRFLVSRFFRLYPAFAIIALVEMTFYYFGNPLFGYGKHPEDITWARTLANYFLYADFVGQKWYVPVFWTLGVEAQFVIAILLVFPLLAHPNRVIASVAVLVWALAPVWAGRGPTLLSYSAMYAMGMVVFLRLHRSLPQWAFLILLACGFYGHYEGISARAAWTGLGTALIIAYLPQLSEQWSRRLKIDYFGQLAYSFFLIHITFGGAVMVHTKFLPDTWVCKLPAVMLAAAFSIFAAAMFHKWIENPCHNYSRRLKAKKD